MTGCPRCDLNNRPMLTENGTLHDQSDDLHRAVHDALRAIRAGAESFSARLGRMLPH